MIDKQQTIVVNVIALDNTNRFKMLFSIEIDPLKTKIIEPIKSTDSVAYNGEIDLDINS